MSSHESDAVSLPWSEKQEIAMKKTLVQLEFAPSAYKRLKEMVEQSRAASNAEAVRQALRLYQWFLEKKNAGLEVVAVDPQSGRHYKVKM